MSKKKLFAAVAFEELEDHPALRDLTLAEGEEPININEVMPESAVQAETLIIDQTKDQNVIGVIEKQLDNAVVVKDALNGAQTVLEESTQNGGLTANTAQILQVLTDNIEASKVEPNDYTVEEVIVKPMPAMEHYVYLRERQLNTQVALESIKESIRAFWLWVIERLKKLGDTLLLYYRRNTTLLQLLELRINRVERYLRGINRSNTRLYIERPSLANGLAINGIFPESIQTYLETFESVTNEVFQWHNANNIDAIITQLKTVVNNPQSDIKKIVELMAEVPTVLKAEGAPSAKLQRYESPDLFGNRRLVVQSIADVENASIDDLASDITRLSVRLDYFEPTRPQATKIPLVTIKELYSTIETCRSCVKTLLGYKAEITRITSIIDSLKQFSTTQVNKPESSLTSDQKAHKRLIENICISLPKLVFHPTLDYSTYCANTVRLLTSYVELAARTTLNESKHV